MAEKGRYGLVIRFGKEERWITFNDGCIGNVDKVNLHDITDYKTTTNAPQVKLCNIDNLLGGYNSIEQFMEMNYLKFCDNSKEGSASILYRSRDKVKEVPPIFGSKELKLVSEKSGSQLDRNDYNTIKSVRKLVGDISNFKNLEVTEFFNYLKQFSLNRRTLDQIKDIWKANKNIGTAQNNLAFSQSEVTQLEDEKENCECRLRETLFNSYKEYRQTFGLMNSIYELHKRRAAYEESKREQQNKIKEKKMQLTLY